MSIQKFPGRTTAFIGLSAALAVFVFGAGPVRAQTALTASQAVTAAAQSMTPQGPVKRLSIDEAVALALEQNLDLQVERLNPQVQDYTISVARSNWVPNFQSAVTTRTQENVPQDIFSGTQATVSEDRVSTSTGVGQLLPWGGNYSANWINGRVTTNNDYSPFQPQLNSTFAANYSQPLMRNFKIDAVRQQYLVSKKNREISDVQLVEAVAQTGRNVRNAYWDLVYALSNLEVQKQSLTLAQQSLRDNRARVEIGTMAPIDIVEAEAEVARREESVIIAEAAISRAEDRLRALISNPSQPDFWTMRIEPSDVATFVPANVDVETAVRNALDRRTDLAASQKQIEANDISIRYLRNQSLPDVTANVNYSALGLGGTQRQLSVVPGLPPTILSVRQKGFGSVLGDAFAGAYPTWNFNVQLSYPIGRSTAEASLARARLQNQQSEKQLESQKLLVATQIRDFARTVQTNSKRVEATRSARALAEKRLEAEQKKFTAGMTSSFLVFQAQRDLSQARNNELQAIIDYLKSVVDFQTAQETPLSGGGGVSLVNSGSTQNTGAASAGSRQQ
ncbi:MAG TPA: TolC family protein [Vicinamibacterales bacterium]|nr:TolC family protein [Vicinamibacterales bacterium]